jgi:hypothetical protein
MATKKKAAKKEHTYQLYDDTWYRSAHGRPPYRHECCDCGLVHNIEYKYEQGSIWEKWNVDTKATVEARKDREKSKAK